MIEIRIHNQNSDSFHRSNQVNTVSERSLGKIFFTLELWGRRVLNERRESGRVFFSIEKERKEKEIHRRSMMINVGTRFEDAWAERIEAWRRGASAGSVRCGLGSTRFRVAVADRCVAMTTLPPPVIQPPPPPPPPDHCLCPLTHPRLLPSPMPPLSATTARPLTHPRSHPSISSNDRSFIEFRAENKIKLLPPNFLY